MLQLAVGFVDRLQQLVEMRRLFNWPDSIERWSKHIQILTREEAYRDDFLRHGSRSH